MLLCSIFEIIKSNNGQDQTCNFIFYNLFIRHHYPGTGRNQRYQGELTLLAETEQQINLSPRWGIVGVTGIETTVASPDDMNFSDAV